MALLALNNTRIAGVNRLFSGNTTVAGGQSKQNIAVPHTRANWSAGEHGVSEVTDTASMPYGVRPPYCFVMARKGGAIKSFNRASVDIAGAAGGELAFPRNASGSVNLDGASSVIGVLSGAGVGLITLSGQSTVEADAFATAAGVLTISATSSAEGAIIATATGSIELGASAIAGLVISATAAATLAVNGASAIEGGIATNATGAISIAAAGDVVGALSSAAFGSIQLSGSSTIEANGLITAAVIAQISGSIEVMGEGFFTASTANTGDDVLTADAVAQAIMGYSVESGYSFLQVTKLAAAILSGKTTVVDNGDGTATVTFRNLTDTTDAAIFEMDGSSRNTRIDDV